MGPTRKPNGPVTLNKYGKSLRCECGKVRCKGTQLCKTCNRELAEERGRSGR